MFLLRLDCKHFVASSKAYRHQSTLQLRLICFLCLAFFKWFALSFQTFPCLLKLSVVDNAYHIFAFFKKVSCLFLLFEEFARQANLNVSSGFCSSPFVLLFLDVLFNGLSKAINLFELSAIVCGL